ncbi:MAG: DNA polymerase III subunit alpha [Pyrinomonadaceae bacterium]|nr:DNA polymerase III subunit alpha [Pyrinomonadaceae bacterium]
MQEHSDKFQFRSKDFVHLHVHSDYSLLQSTIQLKSIPEALKELDMKACAITDYGNMFGAVSFYNTMNYAGLHPIIGYDAFVANGSRFDKGTPLAGGERPYYAVTLLAKDFEGYLNLAYIASAAFTDGFHHKPRIDLELLAEKSKGLIALSGGLEGAVAHYLSTESQDKAEKYASSLKEIFGKDNFFLEIQDHGLDRERNIHPKLNALSKKLEIPIAATNDAHYLKPDDAKAHEVLMCIRDGKTVYDSTRAVLEAQNYHLCSAAEMWEKFGKELPEALTNTLKIAEMCDVKIPLKDNLQLPNFPIPAESKCKTNAEYFEEVVREGFDHRKESVWLPMLDRQELKCNLNDYEERLTTEISIIQNMKFPGYFLIVWDFIKYAVEQGIPVGPGRGSAAGSLVAYCLGITDVDPLQYDLLFERFLNPERVSMPDIDIDFCVKGRGDVINHVSELYGRDSVCQIITFGTMASKAAIKDVGRALNMPYGDVERIAKLIPPPVRGRNISILQAIEQVADLKKLMDADPQVKEVVELALRIEGCARHTSVHAAGVVISPKPLHELVPIAVSGKNELTSQYTMGDLEKVGMLKMDFLALTTLTVINDCLKTLKQQTGTEIDWAKIPLDDPKSLELFADGRTEAIFQFESSGMQQICQRLKPKNLEDLAALNALYRPGPLDGGMVDDFIARHRGEKDVEYILPEMEEILKNTLGILVYQEQIMQLAQKLSGYSLGEADMMRRAMGKKNRAEMEKHEVRFISGAVERGIDKKKAAEIFNLMAQFADYGFNRSHSVAYAYLAFQTAYLKAHFPSYFYASVLSNESQDTAKIYKYSNELRAAGLKLLPPDINESGIGFTPLDNAVRFGLSAIKGIGTTSVEAIIKARDEKGKFTSLFDFVSRIEQGAVNRRGLESLITAGAFDSLMPEEMSVNLWRAKLYAGVNTAISHGQRVWEDKLRGQTGLFGMVETTEVDANSELPEADAWTLKEMSNHEKAAVGFYLSSHPLDEFQKVLRDLSIKNLADYDEIRPGDRITLAGIVAAFQVRHSKKGNRFCIFRLEDQSSGVKCLAWSEAYTKMAEILRDDEVLIVEGKVESNEGQEITLIIDDARRLADAIPQRAQNLQISIPEHKFEENFLEEIFSLLSSSQGKCLVNLEITLEDEIELTIESQPLRIQGSSKLEQDLRDKGCQVNWIL